MLSVVVVEDHAILREALVDRLCEHGYRAYGAPDAEALADELGDVHADIYLLDLNLPGEDGLSLALRLRRAEPGVGIVMLTSRDATSDRVVGYESGADAYLAKPIVLEELDAVVAAVARRVRPVETATETFVLDVRRATLTGPAGTVEVTASQVAVLDALARAQDRTLETWQLIQALGRDPDDYRKATLEVMVARLRERLSGAGAARDAITAVRGSGYRLTIDLKVRRRSRTS